MGIGAVVIVLLLTRISKYRPKTFRIVWKNMYKFEVTC